VWEPNCGIVCSDELFNLHANASLGSCVAMTEENMLRKSQHASGISKLAESLTSINIFASSLHVAAACVFHRSSKPRFPLIDLICEDYRLLGSDTVQSSRNLTMSWKGLGKSFHLLIRDQWKVKADVWKYLWIYLLIFSPALLFYFSTDVTVNYILCT
jgi:hypothetical protein